MSTYIYLAVVTIIVSVIIYLSFKAVSGALLDRFVPNRPDIYAESDDDKNHITEYVDNPVVVKKLQEACRTYMELDEQDKSDYKVYSERVDEILDENDVDNVNNTRIKSCLMEDYYEEERGR